MSLPISSNTAIELTTYELQNRCEPNSPVEAEHREVHLFDFLPSKQPPVSEDGNWVRNHAVTHIRISPKTMDTSLDDLTPAPESEEILDDEWIKQEEPQEQRADTKRGLTKLDLSSNAFESFPEELSQCKSLEILYFSENQLKSLPLSISNLTNLKELDLSSNKFESFPAGICGLKNLEILYFSQNQLQSLPEEIDQPLNLKKLFLSWNQITSLPTTINKLNKLTKLYLTNNPNLESLPDNLADLVPHCDVYVNKSGLPKNAYDAYGRLKRVRIPSRDKSSWNPFYLSAIHAQSLWACRSVSSMVFSDRKN